MKTQPPQSNGGFTRADLITVAAMIAVFSLLAAPRLFAAAQSPEAATCISNMQQMMRALHLYTTDNADFLPFNGDIPNVSAGLNWLQHDARNLPDATNSAKLISNFNMLTPYLNGNAGVFHCPADPSTISAGGKLVPRVRSLSLNHTIGTNFQTPGGKTATDGAWLDGTHGHTANKTYRTYARMADVVNPRPDSLFAFLDEHPNSINDAAYGCMGPRPGGTGYQWIDWPANYHNGGGGLGFMDGHGEIHVWRSNLSQNPPLSSTGQLDMHYLATHATALVTDQP